MTAALEDRLQELNIGEERVTKVVPPDIEQSEEKSDAPSGDPQFPSLVVDDEPTANLGDADSPPMSPITFMTPVITRATPTSFEVSMGYYHPQGWVTGLPTYPMQYMGAYPGYHLPPPMNQTISPASGSDAHRTPSATPASFIPVRSLYHKFSVMQR